VTSIHLASSTIHAECKNGVHFLQRNIYIRLHLNPQQLFSRCVSQFFLGFPLAIVAKVFMGWIPFLSPNNSVKMLKETFVFVFHTNIGLNCNPAFIVLMVLVRFREGHLTCQTTTQAMFKGLFEITIVQL